MYSNTCFRKVKSKRHGFLDYLVSWNLVWKLFSTKLDQLANLLAKSAKLYLQNQIYQAKCSKCKEPNIPNQIYSIKPVNLIHPTNSTKPNLYKLKSPIPACTELGPAQPQLVTFYLSKKIGQQSRYIETIF